MYIYIRMGTHICIYRYGPWAQVNLEPKQAQGPNGPMQAQVGPSPSGPGRKWTRAQGDPGPSRTKPKWDQAQVGPSPSGPEPKWAAWAQAGPGRKWSLGLSGRLSKV